MKKPVALVGLVAVATLGVSACGSSSSSSSNKTSKSAAASNAVGPLGKQCSPGALKTVKNGVLTLAADQPVYPPWYVNNDPTNGKGFEDAVAYAVAKELGYSTANVKWTRVTFNNAITPGPKTFDYDLDEFSIDATRAKAVDFSTPYYTVAEAVVTIKGTAASKITTMAQLRKLQLGAQVGSTDLTAIEDQIKPHKQAMVYNSNADAVQALENGQIQGLVLDLPTAFELTQGEAKGSVITGQLPNPQTGAQKFGILLPKGSSLTSCVDKAVQAITANGTLKQLTKTWLADVADAPVIKS